MLNNKKTKTLLSLAVLIIALVMGVPIFNVSNSPATNVPQTKDTSDPYWGESADSSSAETPSVEGASTEIADNSSAESESTEIADNTSAESESAEAAASESADSETDLPVVAGTIAESNLSEEFTVTEDGEYMSKEEVALYLYSYGHLPSNYITKSQAQDLGWVSSKGNLNKVAPGKSIGGDRFGNREGLLPDKKGRKYYECDIDYTGGTRNAKRIIFSNDGLIYYTEDHYNSFELLYGEE